MPSLLDEVEAEAKASRPGSKCAICQWLRGLPDKERSDWEEVFAAPLERAPHTTTRDVLNKHGHPFSLHQVTNHRKEHAWGPRVEA